MRRPLVVATSAVGLGIVVAAAVVLGVRALPVSHHGAVKSSSTALGTVSPSSAAATSRPPTPSGTAATSTALTWIINGTALREVLAIDPAAASVFNNPHTFVLFDGSSTRPALPAGWTGVVTLVFKSEATLQSALDSGVSSNVGAVLYDNEHWSFTPLQEQQNPAHYEALAAAAAHAHHLTFIAAPAVDLTRVLEPGASDHYAAYLRAGIASGAARYADVIDLQAQNTEIEASSYVAFVTGAAAQARAANAHVTVLAGLTTNGSGVTPGLLASDFTAVRATVAGFWLNVPGQGASCPNCGPARPDIAAAFLNDLHMRGAI